MGMVGEKNSKRSQGNCRQNGLQSIGVGLVINGLWQGWTGIFFSFLLLTRILGFLGWRWVLRYVGTAPLLFWFLAVIWYFIQNSRNKRVVFFLVDSFHQLKVRLTLRFRHYSPHGMVARSCILLCSLSTHKVSPGHFDPSYHRWASLHIWEWRDTHCNGLHCCQHW